MALTIKPDSRDGTVQIIDDRDGSVIGTGMARASKTEPGYVAIISEVQLGWAIRVPADWLAELAKQR